MKFIIVIACYLFAVFAACDTQTSFESEKWKSSGGELILTDQRLRMTDDLLSQRLLLDKKQREIDNLLGPSSLLRGSSKEIQFYPVKEVYTNNIDPDKIVYIAVEFDKDGRSVDVQLLEK